MENKEKMEPRLDVSFILLAGKKFPSFQYITKIVNSLEVTEGYQKGFLRSRFVSQNGIRRSISSWYSNGVQEFSLKYSDSDQLEGLQTSFYFNGSCEYVLNFKEGELSGKQVRYDKNGKILATFWYENNVLIPDKKEVDKKEEDKSLTDNTGPVGVTGITGPTGPRSQEGGIWILQNDKEEKKDIYSDDSHNIKLMFTSLEENNFESFKFLLENTKDVNIQATKNNNNFMHYLKNNEQKEYILKKGFSPKDICSVLPGKDLVLIKLYLDYVPKAKDFDINDYCFNWSIEKVQLFMEYGMIKDLLTIAKIKYHLARDLGFKFDFDKEDHLKELSQSNSFREIVYHSSKEEIYKLYEYLKEQEILSKFKRFKITTEKLTFIYKFEQVIFAIKTTEELDIKLKDFIQWKIGKYNYYGYETKDKTNFDHEDKILSLYDTPQFYII